MGRIFSVHEYDLHAEIGAAKFERAIREAETSRLLEIPGLTSHFFLRGVKGERTGRHAALYVYENREAWERIWGPPTRPLPPEAYPPGWRRWEGILAPLLDRPAETTRFTAYEEMSG